MNRSSFLQSAMGLAAALTLPFIQGYAKFRSFFNKGILVRSGKDRHDKPLFLFEGDVFYSKVTTADSGGGLFIFESIRDRKGGPPLHLHFEQDEWWYILEGEFLFKIGEETFTAGPGDSVFGPRQVPHTFSKINEGNARMIIAYQPAGRMEKHFQSMADGTVAKMTVEERARFQESNGFRITGPALTIDKTTPKN